jgi:hypothetical protein
MRRGCTTSHHNEGGPEWNGVTRDLHRPQILRHSCQLARSLDSEGVIHVDFLPHGITVHSITVTCFVMMCTKHFGRKDPGKLPKIILLHDNACPRAVNLTK